MSNPTNRVLNHFIRHQQIYLLVLLVLILLSPLIPRYTNLNFLPPGEVSYFNLAATEQVNLKNIYQNPYQSFLALNFLHLPLLYQALQFLLAIASFFLLYHLLKELKLSDQNRFFFLLFYTLSPAFIFTFTVLNHHAFYIFLNLLGFTLLFQKKKIFNYLSLPIFALIPFFDIFSSLFTILLLETYFYFKNRAQTSKQPWWSMQYLKNDNFAKIIFLLISTLTIFNITIGKEFLLGPFQAQNIFLDLFSDFGSLFGLSFFLLLLTIIGLTTVWKKEKIFLAYLFIPLFILFLIYQTSLLIYLNFFIIFLAAAGFTYLLNKEWKLNIIKNFSLFLLILGILFSTFTSIQGLTQLPPQANIKASFTSLQDVTSTQKTIFSHPQDSYLIEYFGQRPAFIHYHDPDFKAKQNLTNQIFQSTYIKNTFPLLEENELYYIYLSPKTKQDLPLDRGLLFLFQNERFKRIYAQNNTEVWEFTS